MRKSNHTYVPFWIKCICFVYIVFLSITDVSLANNRDNYADPVFETQKKQASNNNYDEKNKTLDDLIREEHQKEVSNTFARRELLYAAHDVFGKGVTEFASVLEEIFRTEGRPVAYIIGEEGSGALMLGLTYGEGIYRFKNGNSGRVYWQGPTFGLDTGGNVNKTMVLVYKAVDERDLVNNFTGVSGSVYYIGGFTVMIQSWRNVRLVTAKLGLGLRLGVNFGYLKYRFTPQMNPL